MLTLNVFSICKMRCAYHTIKIWSGCEQYYWLGLFFVFKKKQITYRAADLSMSSYPHSLRLVAHDLHQNNRSFAKEVRCAQFCADIRKIESSSTAKTKLSRTCAPLRIRNKMYTSQPVYHSVISGSTYRVPTSKSTRNSWPTLSVFFWLSHQFTLSPSVAQNSARCYLLQSGALLCCFCYFEGYITYDIETGD